MASTARAFVHSRFPDLSSLRPRRPLRPPPELKSPPLISLHRRRGSRSPSSSGRVLCLVSGGGGVSDEFVSTRRSSLDQGFSVIANMLRRIEPLDTSVISKGVSDSAKDSMKETISTMLGLLPSDQFSVTVNVSEGPLDRLLVSSIITGYTLWNAEYRISLMRNFDIPMETSEKLKGSEPNDDLEGRVISEKELDIGFGTRVEDLETKSAQVFGDLSPEALDYIQRLQSELSQVKEELNDQKQENIKVEYSREHRNDLLDYLRSLDSSMVTELSKPSSVEVEEIIHQLVKNITRRFFKDDSNPNFIEDSVSVNHQTLTDGSDEFCDTIGTERDYLAKLLFWCMLLGHHLRGLENRLHLSCVVGLL